MDKREQEFDEKIRRKLSEGSVDFDEAIDFDEAAWKKMEQRLQPDKRPRGFLPPWWLRVAAAVLFAGLGIWAYTSYFRDVSDPGRDMSSVAVNQAPVTAPPTREEQRTETEQRRETEENREMEHGSETEQRTAMEQQPIRKGPAEMEKSTVREEEPALRAGAVPLGAGRISSAEGSRVVKSASSETVGTQADRDGAQADLSGDAGVPSDNTDIIAQGLSRRTVATGIVPARPEWPAAQDLWATAPPPGQEEGSGGSDLVSAASGKGITFSLGVLAAPDLNGVGGFGRSKVGFNAGLNLGVHFNDRLSLHSGIVYARKPYDARPADYSSRYSPPDLVHIAAVCDVIDIPLNLRYTFYRKGLNSISLSAGLSSYLMLREQYEYEYQYDEARMYEYKNENRHFMGVGNLGLSLERKISDKMSIGLTPFIKVPLTGIGQGSVRLISAGAGLHFHLDMSKNRNTSINK